MENIYKHTYVIIGTYEEHKDIPLAIKAIIKVIYEPPQVNIQLLVNNNLQIINN